LLQALREFKAEHSLANSCLPATKSGHSCVIPVNLKHNKLFSLGAIIVKGDFDNVEALEEAAQSSDAVFINTTPTYPNTIEINQVAKIIAAAKNAGTVKYAIYSSTILAGKHEQLKAWEEFKAVVSWVWEGKNANQEQVRHAGFEHWTILQPGLLTTNWVLPMNAKYWPRLAKEHVLFSAFGESTPLPLTAPEDVARAALAALEASAAGRSSGLLDAIVPIVGDHLTTKKIADDVSATTGIQVETEAAPEADVRKDIRLAMQALLTKETELHFNQAKELGLKTTTFKEFLAENKEAATKALQG